MNTYFHISQDCHHRSTIKTKILFLGSEQRVCRSCKSRFGSTRIIGCQKQFHNWASPLRNPSVQRLACSQGEKKYHIIMVHTQNENGTLQALVMPNSLIITLVSLILHQVIYKWCDCSYYWILVTLGHRFVMLLRVGHYRVKGYSFPVEVVKWTYEYCIKASILYPFARFFQRTWSLLKEMGALITPEWTNVVQTVKNVAVNCAGQRLQLLF